METAQPPWAFVSLLDSLRRENVSLHTHSEPLVLVLPHAPLKSTWLGLLNRLPTDTGGHLLGC